ncbi:MAG: hypothetical protein ACE5HO_12910 [bacterium]
MLKHFSAVVVLCCICAGSSVAQAQTGKFSGYMFGDYYYVVNNHDDPLEGRNGFWFRRIYFTYDQGLGEEFSVRFRLEMKNAGDFAKKSKLEPFVKDGYLKWSRSHHAIYLGLSPTPTWNYIEKVWGYRAVEKTPADLYKFGSSRDFGVAVKGSFGGDKQVAYHFMFSNGSSTGSETNEGKKVALSLGYRLTKELSVEVYGDFEERPGASDRYTAQGFLTYQTARWRAGAQLVHQTRQQVGDNAQLQLASAFAAAQVREELWAFVRFDRSFDPIPEGPKVSFVPFDGTAKLNFLLLGADYRPHKQVHLMPNVELAFYDSVNGERPNADVIPRFTFYYVWK